MRTLRSTRRPANDSPACSQAPLTRRRLLATALAGGLVASARPVSGEAPLRVAATIFPLWDIAREVAGAVAEIVLLLPPGASPHTFEPTPAKMRELAGARVVFVIGHGLDDWAARMAQGVGVERQVRVDRSIALRRFGGDAHGHGAGAVDPHYWLGAANAQAIARTVADELERLAPARRDEVRANLARYLRRLEETDAAIRRLLEGLPSRRIATFHDAFGYFADAYGLEVVAVFEPFPGKEPSPRFVRDFQAKVRAARVRVLFAEPQLALDALRPVARDLGVTLSILDPLGGAPGRESYPALLRFNARQVADALRAGRPATK